ncbi:MAG: hypothetical protein LC808_23895 [Actinobacteria bacterium]|nr:hypothetical protein [Actinomycetota bacterium]
MIVQWLVEIGLAIFGAIFSWMPTWTVPNPDTGAINGLSDAAVLLNQFLPLGTLFAVVGLLLALHGAIGLYHLAVFVYDKLPFKAA